MTMKTKLTRAEIKGLIRAGAIWLITLIAWRILTMIFWGMFFGSTIDAELSLYETSTVPRTVTILSSLVAMLILAAVSGFNFARNNGDQRRALIEASREEGFSLLVHMKKFIPLYAVSMGLYVLTQLPFCGFFAAFGFKYNVATGSTAFEKLHVADAGFYLLTGSALLGLLLNIIIMTALLVGARMLVLYTWQKETLER